MQLQTTERVGYKPAQCVTIDLSQCEYRARMNCRSTIHKVGINVSSALCPCHFQAATSLFLITPSFRRRRPLPPPPVCASTACQEWLSPDRLPDPIIPHIKPANSRPPVLVDNGFLPSRTFTRRQKPLKSFQTTGAGHHILAVVHRYSLGGVTGQHLAALFRLVIWIFDRFDLNSNGKISVTFPIYSQYDTIRYIIYLITAQNKT